MGAIVFASTGSRKYHFDRQCKAFHNAQDINDWDCDEYCRHHHPVPRPLKRMSSEKAAMDGKLPCLTCVPQHLRAMPNTETFGHEPVVRVDALDGPQPNKPPVCARCIRHVRKRSSWTVGYDERAGVQWENGWVHLQFPVTWPCTSAIVLGLTPRVKQTTP